MASCGMTGQGQRDGALAKGPQPGALRWAGYTGAQLKSQGYEPGALEVVGASRETPVKSLRGYRVFL